MRTLVVDTNRVISALLREGETRRALLGTGATLFAPQFLQEEIVNNLPELARRVGIGADTLARALAPLLKRVLWVTADEYAVQLPKAVQALARVDPDDVPFLACALAVGADAIWSFDTDFDEQRLVPRIPHPDAPIPQRE